MFNSLCQQLVASELFTITEGHTRRGTGELDRGHTIGALPGTTPIPLWNDAPLAKVAVDVDNDKLEKLFVDTYAL